MNPSDYNIEERLRTLSACFALISDVTDSSGRVGGGEVDKALSWIAVTAKHELDAVIRDLPGSVLEQLGGAR